MGRKWTRMRGRKRHWTTEETKWEVNGSRRFIANWTDASDACAFAQERTFRQTLHPTHLLNESISNRSMTAIYMCNNQFFFCHFNFIFGFIIRIIQQLKYHLWKGFRSEESSWCQRQRWSAFVNRLKNVNEHWIELMLMGWVTNWHLVLVPDICNRMKLKVRA